MKYFNLIMVFVCLVLAVSAAIQENTEMVNFYVIIEMTFLILFRIELLDDKK